MTEHLQRLADQVKDPAGVLKVIDLMRDRAQAGEIEKARNVNRKSRSKTSWMPLRKLRRFVGR